MELLVVGATGRTGTQIVQAAVQAGHTVRAFARSAAHRAWPEGVTPIAGSVLEADAVNRAVQGVHAIVVAISMVRTSNNPWARITTPTDLHVRAATLLTEAAARHGVRRYVTVSAHGVGTSKPRAGTLFMMLVHASNIGVAYADLARAEEVVSASTLDWCIVRPTRLTEGAPRGRWEADPALLTSSRDHIARADLAAFLVREAELGAHTGQAVSVTG